MKMFLVFFLYIKYRAILVAHCNWSTGIQWLWSLASHHSESIAILNIQVSTHELRSILNGLKALFGHIWDHACCNKKK